MTPAIRVTRTVELDLCEKGDDYAFSTVTLNLTCTVGPGCTLTSPYHPGAGDEVILVECSGVADGVLGGSLLDFLPFRKMAEAWLDRNQDEIIADAADKMDAERERQADWKGEAA